MVFFSKLSIAGIDVYIIIINKIKQLQFKLKRKIYPLHLTYALTLQMAPNDVKQVLPVL